MQQWQKDLMDNYEKLLVKDDSVIYQSDCLRCGGKCCTNKDVMVNPYDIWRIVNDEQASEIIGIKSSHDLYTGNNVTGKPMLQYYLGPESRLPLSAIKMAEVNDGLTICPFASPVKTVKDDKDYASFKSNEWEQLDYMKADDGNPALICVIDKVKPVICRAFPLGRAGKMQLASSSENKNGSEKNPDFPKMQYILMDDKMCEKYRNSEKKMTVKEYVTKWNLDELYKMSDLIMDWHEYLDKHVKNEKARFLMGLALYDFDLPAVTLMTGKTDKETIQKLRPPDFEALLDLNYSMCERMCKDKRFTENP